LSLWLFEIAVFSFFSFKVFYATVRCHFLFILYAESSQSVKVLVIKSELKSTASKSRGVVVGKERRRMLRLQPSRFGGYHMRMLPKCSRRLPWAVVAAHHHGRKRRQLQTGVTGDYILSTSGERDLDLRGGTMLGRGRALAPLSTTRRGER
jgi:hypothetical protein